MPRGTHRLLLLLLVAPCLSAGGRTTAAEAAEAPAGEDDPNRQLTLYTEVLSLVDRAYVEETDAATLVFSSLEGAVDALDPFSLYVPPAEVDAYLAAQAVARDRSGLLILKERGVAYVAAVDDGSPAQRAALEQGQIIEKLQGRRTRGMPVWRIRQLLGAPAGTALQLELLDRGGEKRSAALVLAEFAKPRPHVRTVRGVPILRISGFSGQTAADVDELLLDREERLLVVDLRGVAGGDPEAAFGVAERFADGELGSLAGRDGSIRSFRGPVPPIWEGTLAVLVDRGTQGAAELLATVLRQSRGARLVGERTFGHAGRTDAIDLPSGARLELTGAFYTGLDAEPLNRGLEPDLRIRPGPELAAGSEEDPPARDEILERAVELLLESDRGSGEA